MLFDWKSTKAYDKNITQWITDITTTGKIRTGSICQNVMVQLIPLPYSDT